MSNQEKKIESCPYCKTVSIVDCIPICDHNNRTYAYYIYCSNPKCRVTSPIRFSEEEAIKTWNSMTEAIRSSLNTDA